MGLSREFLEGASCLRCTTMGTEHLAELLYSLVRFTRPRRVLEIGAGYTTLFILKALADNLDSYRTELRCLEGTRATGDDQSALLLRRYYDSPYEPVLVSIDDFSDRRSTAHRVSDVAQTLGLAGLLELLTTDFREALPSLKHRLSPIDFAWLDCGAYDNYQYFIEHVWPYVNGDGGLVMFHSTETNLEAQAFMRKMKLWQATTAFEKFELCSLLEPHKVRQNSVALFRITRDLQERIYSLRA
jgi:predicted O-methyltransferase YrrM